MNRLILGCGYLGRRVAEAWIAQDKRLNDSADPWRPEAR